jgi:ABC-type glycerol-3-phosphate transport system substrate-binding protein
MIAEKHKFFVSAFLAFLLVVSMAAYGGGTSDKANEAAGGDSGALAGQGLKAESGAEIEVTYWESSSSDKAGWDLVLSLFAKDHPEIKIKPQVYPSNTYRDQLDTRIAANDWPDVMRYTYQRLGKFKEADVMLDLTNKISAENLADLVPAYYSAMTHQGRLVGMPHHTDTIAIFYNKRMFAESGIRIPKNARDGWTWDELNQIAAKLKTDHKLDYAFAGIWENGSGYRFLPFIYAAGGSVLSADQSKITINSPEALKGIQLYEGWRKNNLVNRTGFTASPNANMLFVAQQIAFTFSGSWHCSYMKENMPDNWGVTYMPQINGKTGSDMGGNGLFAYKKTKYPNAAAIFIEYTTSKDIVKQFCEASNFIPVRQSLINEGLKYSAFQKEMDLFLEIVATIDPKMAADETSTRFQQLNVIFGEEMDPLVIDGSVTAQQVVEKLNRRMNEAMNQ